MQAVYQMKEHCRIDILKELGWIEIPETQMVVKEVSVPMESDLIKTVLIETYLNPEWLKENDLDSSKKAKEIGIKYTKNGIDFSKKFCRNITRWFLTFDLDNANFLMAINSNGIGAHMIVDRDELTKYFYDNIRKLKYYDVISEIEAPNGQRRKSN